MLARLTFCLLLTLELQLFAQDAIKHIMVGSNMKHPPFSSWDSAGKPVGIEVDIVRLAAKELGVETEFVERPFGDLIDLVVSNSLDVAVSTIGRTELRATKVAFSEPYFSTKIVALVSPQSKIQSLAQLESCSIGADIATTSFVAAKRQWPNCQIVSQVEPGLSWPQMIYQKKIEAFIVDASDVARIENESGLKLRQIKTPLASESFFIAMQKDKEQLLSAINSAIEVLKPTVEYRIGHKFQLQTKLGRKISSSRNPPAKLVRRYFEAKSKFEAEPDNPEAIIWYGRRAGYLLRMNEAIELFTVGINKHPSDPRMYRHRGHRYISIRQFDKAIADLEKAVTLIKDKPDRVEPDGAPNSKGIPLTTTHGNIWYHLGLAYYLKGDLPNALRCYNQRIALEKYDDNVVANAHWKYMILRRMGKRDEANQVVTDISKKMSIIENDSYHKMCLFYNQSIKIPIDNLISDGDSGTDVLLYGLGNWYLYDRKDLETTVKLYQNLFESGSPFSFAYIAAESDFVRLFNSSKR